MLWQITLWQISGIIALLCVVAYNLYLAYRRGWIAGYRAGSPGDDPIAAWEERE